MKKAILLFVTLLFLFTSGIAQLTHDEYSKSLEGINVVVLNLSGNSTLLLSGSNDLKINSFLTIKGDVWGIKVPSKRPGFRITYRQSGDTIFISSPEKYIPGTIGISNYSEKTDNIILMPANKRIIVQKADFLDVEDRFSSIDVIKSGTVSIRVEENDLHELNCTAGRNLKINDLAQSLSFVLRSKGTDSVRIIASDININLIINRL